MNTSDLHKFYKQFRADLKEGFVANTELGREIYIKKKLGGLPEGTIREITESLKIYLDEEDNN